MAWSQSGERNFATSEALVCVSVHSFNKIYTVIYSVSDHLRDSFSWTSYNLAAEIEKRSQWGRNPVMRRHTQLSDEPWSVKSARLMIRNLKGAAWLFKDLTFCRPDLLFIATCSPAALFLYHNGEDTRSSLSTSVCYDIAIIISKHKTFKGYKAIFQDIGISVSTVHNVIKRFLPSMGLSRAFQDLGENWRENSPKVGANCGWKKNKNKKTPRLTSKDIKSNLEESGVKVSKAAHETKQGFMDEGQDLCQRVSGQTTIFLRKCFVDRWNIKLLLATNTKSLFTGGALKLIRKRTPYQQRIMVEDL